QGFQHLRESAGDRSSMLARLPVAGVVALGIDHDPHLGVAVERYAARLAEDFFSARAQVIRDCRHRFSVGCWLSNPPGRAVKSAQARPLAKTGFSLDYGADFGESRDCQVTEISRPCRHAAPLLAGFAVSGVLLRRMVDTTPDRLGPVSA